MHPRQPATRAEARALAHPLRLRIIRLTVGEALTLTQLSHALSVDKATLLHHVRTLLREGFLAEAPLRRSPTGRSEKPYRSTGKSMAITFGDAPEVSIAALDAYRQEIAGHHDPLPLMIRRPLRLDAASREELSARLTALIEEFEARSDAGGQVVNFLAIGVAETTEPEDF